MSLHAGGSEGATERDDAVDDVVEGFANDDFLSSEKRDGGIGGEVNPGDKIWVDGDGSAVEAGEADHFILDNAGFHGRIRQASNIRSQRVMRHPVREQARWIWVLSSRRSSEGRWTSSEKVQPRPPARDARRTRKEGKGERRASRATRLKVYGGETLRCILVVDFDPAQKPWDRCSFRRGFL